MDLKFPNCVSSCGFMVLFLLPSALFSDFSVGSRGGLLYVQMVHQEGVNITIVLQNW